MSIINLTQHVASQEQVDQGVTDLPADKRNELQGLLTFATIPSQEEMVRRAEAIAELAKRSGCETAMCGGAPYFMSVLEKVLWSAGIKPVYAFSVRESQDIQNADGSVRKVAVFRHLGFVEAGR